jgi:hypothetical protein
MSDAVVVCGEEVRVAAIFEPGKRVRPVWFERNRRQHRIVEITYSWTVREGAVSLFCFAVSDGEALFELIYNPLVGSWTLAARQATS